MWRVLIAAVAGALLGAGLVHASPQVVQVAVRGPASFSLGRAPAVLTIAQHPTGEVVLVAGDGGASVTCAEYSAEMWPRYRAFFTSILATWFSDRFLAYGSADPDFIQHVDEPAVCDVSARTSNYRVFIDVAQIEHGRRTGIVTVEISPTKVSHTIVEEWSVQRAEDNGDGARAALAVAAAAAAAGGAASGDARGGAGAAASLLALAPLIEIEDTTTYYRTVIEAHTDLTLLVLVLDARARLGAIPSNRDVEAAYRLKDTLDAETTKSFADLLAVLAKYHDPTAALASIQTCPRDQPRVACLATLASEGAPAGP